LLHDLSCLKQMLQLVYQLVGLSQLASPNNDDLPAQLFQFAPVFLVIGGVAGKFLLPELFVCGGRGGVFAALVPVPEASMNEDDGFVFRQDDVGFSGEIFHMQSEPVSGPVQHGPDDHFRLGVLASDPAHIP